jgi:acetyl-CoA acetyltransferase
MSKEKAKELGLTPIAKIKGFADAAQDPDVVYHYPFTGHS